MAVRPLTFGLRFREEGRTVRVRANRNDSRKYVVEVEQDSKTTRRDYPSLSWALRRFARSWRERLN
jgi:hypothetical protein